MIKIKNLVKDIGPVAKKAVTAWWASDPFRQSAVVAYYAIFSMPALLVIIVASAGLVFGHEAVNGEISKQIGTAVSEDAGKQIEDIIAKASERENSIIAAIISVITLILGATAVFGQLQITLNQIWEVKVSAKKKWLKLLKDRVFSFGLILSIGFLLLISLLLTTVLAAFSEWIKTRLPDFMLFIFQVLNFTVSLGVISVLFALMFKILPDAKIKWRNIWVGAVVTSILFIIGKFGLGIYFGKAQPGSTYGAAGSIILIMLWVSYSCMIVFLGAEFTKQYTLHKEGKIEPKSDAELIEPDEEKQLVKEKRKATEQMVSH